MIIIKLFFASQFRFATEKIYLQWSIHKKFGVVYGV